MAIHKVRRQTISRPKVYGRAIMIRQATPSSVASPDSPTQENRFLGIETPLGGDVLLLTSFNGGEELSRPFVYHLEMLSRSDSIDPDEVIGRRVTVRIGALDGEPTYFNGFVSQFSLEGRDREYYRYTAEVVSWLWFLTRRTNCRIFQEKTVPEIVEHIFREHSFTDFEVADLRGTYRRREYCVQYRESDFNFVSRLMEEEGIFYYFQHERGRHTLVLADGQHTFRFGAEREVDYVGSHTDRIISDGISQWQRDGAFTSGRWAQTDYNFLTPRRDLRTGENTVLEVPRSDELEIFEYPARYGELDEGRRLARIRMEALEVRHNVISGTGTCRTLTPGKKFTLGGEGFCPDEGQTFVPTSVRHYATEPAPYVGGHTGSRRDEREYENTFTCISDSVPFRPRRVTPRPTMPAAQTAVVTGPEGEEIWTDKYGRVKVQFHWDREGQHDDRTSCWVRVAQAWAGEQWGVHFWPRIGHEVVLSFLDGDPDRPLIIGSVYNADNMPPYEMPGAQTRSGIKTRSTPNGSSDNFNEIRFEDKKGHEELYFHAERQLNTVVEADESRTVGHDQTIEIDHDRSVKVDNDDMLEVKETRKVAAKRILFDASQEILLQCGGGYIKIDAGGNITINGTLVRIN